MYAQRDVASSSEMFHRLFNGSMPAIPDLNMFAVDVRDVALAHLRAMVKPEADGRRFLMVADTVPLREIGATLASQLNPLYGLPTWHLPNWVLGVMTWFDGSLRMVSQLLGRVVRFDCTPVQSVLGLTMRPPRPGMVDMAYGMIALGALPDRTPDHRHSGPELAARYAGYAPTADELAVGAVVGAAAVGASAGVAATSA